MLFLKRARTNPSRVAVADFLKANRGRLRAQGEFIYYCTTLKASRLNIGTFKESFIVPNISSIMWARLSGRSHLARGGPLAVSKLAKNLPGV